MIVIAVNPKADRRGALLQCFSECLVEVDLNELKNNLVSKEYLEEFFKDKFREKK